MLVSSSSTLICSCGSIHGGVETSLQVIGVFELELVAWVFWVAVIKLKIVRAGHANMQIKNVWSVA